jgi:hypothetical protein
MLGSFGLYQTLLEGREKYFAAILYIPNEDTE